MKNTGDTRNFPIKRYIVYHSPSSATSPLITGVNRFPAICSGAFVKKFDRNTMPFVIKKDYVGIVRFLKILDLENYASACFCAIQYQLYTSQK